MTRIIFIAVLAATLCVDIPVLAQVAIHGDVVHTAAGEPLDDTIVLVEDGKISAIGAADEVSVPDGFRVLRAKVVTPGLIDARSTIGVSGYLNEPHTQDQFERSQPMQPELRAIDAYNPREPLIEWARGYGVTTIHTGHAPGPLISGQTAVVKTRGKTIDEAVIKPVAMIAATFGEGARESRPKAPGTRAKMAAMLRSEFIKAREYKSKQSSETEADKPARDLRLEMLVKILSGELPLLVTAHRTQDLMTVLRIRSEFDIPVVLDGATEAYEVLDQIRDSGVAVIIHPTMMRANGETENASFGTITKLFEAGIPTALQGGYEGYVPKSRLILFEAGIAAAHGLGFDNALRSITINAAKILGVDSRVGSLEIGKDGDFALYDGDPFEYTTHCVAVVIEGDVVSEESR